MIRYDAAAKIFTLSTPHTSYQMKTDADGRLLHTWYGRRLPDSCPDMAEPRAPHTDPGCWPDLLPLEYPAPGTADNRCCAVCPEYADGTELPICGTHPTRSCPASTACPLCLLFGKMQTPRAFALRCGTPPVCRSSFGMLCIRTATSLPVPPS